MAKLKKITEIKSVGYDTEIRCSVKDLINRLEGYIEEYGEDVVIYSECPGYDGYDEFFLSFERDETVEEQKIRLTAAREKRERKAIAKAKKEERDRKEYERLKIQYG